MNRLLLVLAFLAVSIGTAAPQGTARVVSSCGTLPLAYASGATREVTVDLNGKLCTDVTSTAATTIADGADVNAGAIGDAAATAGSTGTLSGKLRYVTSILGTISSNIASILTNSATIVTNTTNTTLLDPCQTVAATITPISITTATTTRIANPVASNKIYICSLQIATNLTNAVAVFEGTGATCTGSPTGVVGGITPANGFNLAANGQATVGGGVVAGAKTGTVNTALCLATSIATPIAGVLRAVYAP